MIEEWAGQYLRLRETKKELVRFMEERYERYLQEIARAYALAREPLVKLPCPECKVNVSGLVPADKGWYFEWTCRAGGYGCEANTCGWYVPLDILEEELVEMVD